MQWDSFAAAPDAAAELVELARGRSGRRCRSRITVALGTSMPTSITVVATSTSVVPSRKRGHRVVLFVGAHLAVQHRRGARPASGPLLRAARIPSATLLASSRPSSSICGSDDVRLPARLDLLADELVRLPRLLRRAASAS